MAEVMKFNDFKEYAKSAGKYLSRIVVGDGDIILFDQCYCRILGLKL